MTKAMVDLVVIGGGINGAGIACDASGRGLRVLLAEADDLASATSSASSKLIHGGLRYLEQYAFRLVREALAEREVLLAKAPHIIWPLRFVLPHEAGMRPKPMLRAGLFLYDHLSRRRALPSSHALDLADDPAGRALAERFASGFCYWDCWVDDARLVVANVLAAQANGAEIRTRTPVTGLAVHDGQWRVSLGGPAGERTVVARAVVNAAGPWVEPVARLAGERPADTPHLRLVKGAHIVVPRIAGADDAYIFQNRDGRVVFALPFERSFTLIGTTDSPYSGDPRQVTVNDADRAYLLGVANSHFRVPLSERDIVWQFAGVRPLDDDGSANPSAVSRDYRLHLDATAGAPLLHVIGGKVTTYRRLAEAALEKLGGTLAVGVPWTATAALPGGDVGPGGYAAWFATLVAQYPAFDAATLGVLARRYGTRCTLLLADAKSPSDLGRQLGGGLSEREVRFLRREEWARTASDVLWRRTKAGLHVPPDDRDRVTEAVQSVLDAC